MPDARLAHEGLSIAVIYGLLGIVGVLELNKAKARHDTAIDDATIGIEELVDVLGARVRGKTAKVESARHVVGMVGEGGGKTVTETTTLTK